MYSKSNDMKKFPFHKFKIEFDKDDKEVLHFGGYMVFLAFVSSIVVVAVALGFIEIFKLIEKSF